MSHHKNRQRTPKSAYSPSRGKSPVSVEDVDALEGKKFKWRAVPQYVDYDQEEWGWGRVGMQKFFDKCLKHLQHYEDKTWMQIKEEQHCHPVPLTDITAKAQTRINNKYGGLDNLWQVKTEGRCRLFGLKDGQIFYLIWHDENHTVYPGGR
jgi:hypothetical protein